MNEQPTSEANGQNQGTDLVVERSVPAPLKSVWDALMTKAGGEALLGEGGVLGDKGDDWQAADGSRGVIRSFHPMEQIRFSWRPSDDAAPSLVELDLTGEGDATNLRLSHSKLTDDADRAALRERWEKVLDRIDGAAGA